MTLEKYTHLYVNLYRMLDIIIDDLPNKMEMAFNMKESMMVETMLSKEELRKSLCFLESDIVNKMSQFVDHLKQLRDLEKKEKGETCGACPALSAIN